MIKLRIIAKFVVKDEYREALLKESQSLVDASRAESGNVQYDLHQDSKNPNELIFIEEWKSQAAIDEHKESPHFKKFGKMIEGKIDSIDVKLIEKIY